MLRSLRVPERAFAIANWLVSLVFAGFLVGMGGKLIADLPGVQQTLVVENFVDRTAMTSLRSELDSLHTRERSAGDERDRAVQMLNVAQGAFTAERESFDAWIATRRATTDPAQDSEVLGRTRVLDTLRSAQRRSEVEVARLDSVLLDISQGVARNTDAQDALLNAASGDFERARFRQELKVFALRLLITLPLLLLAGWLVARKRRDRYWPLYRGIVVFGVFVFFVELVPYLPSYGGYVRYGVGIIATAIAGIYLIRAMQRYMALRQKVEQQSESERRRALPYEEALRRIDTGVCPGCERRIAMQNGLPMSYCVHCGMRLFDECSSCGTRKNAFFPYCPGCGVTTGGQVQKRTVTASPP